MDEIVCSLREFLYVYILLHAYVFTSYFALIMTILCSLVRSFDEFLLTLHMNLFNFHMLNKGIFETL
jgi:hypothetical protein